MQPQQDPYAPQTTPVAAPKKRNGRKIAGLILVIAPSALIILGIALAFGTMMLRSALGDGIALGDTPLYARISAILTFLMTGVGILAWLPCLIIGIIFLATQKSDD